MKNTNISTLSLYDLDEYAFFFVVKRMAEGFVALRPMDMLNISYFSYGYGFFFPLLAVASPAFALGSYPGAIFIIRFLSALWTLALIALGGRWLHRQTGSWAWALAGSLLLLAMPGFLRQGVWIHPEPLMNFCVLAAILMAGRLDPGRLRDVLLIGVVAGIAMSVKFQALIYIPFPGLLLLARAWLAREGDASHLRRLLLSLRPAVIMGGVAVLTYVVLDPFLLIPVGQHAFWADLQDNLASNRTNHFSNILPTAGQKMAMLGEQYVAPLLVLAAVAVAGWLLVAGRVAWKTATTELVLMLCGLVTGLYVFATVQKVWPHYYAMSYILFALGFVSLAGRAVGGMAQARAVQIIQLASVAVLALVMIFRAPPAIGHFLADDRPAAAAGARIAALASQALPGNPAGRKVLISPRTPFAFQRLGLSLTQVKFIAGPLSLRDAAVTDLVILRKDDIYFQEAFLTRRDALGEGARSVRQALDQLHGGAREGVRLCGEDQTVVLLCGVGGAGHGG